MRATKLRHAPTEGAHLQGLRMIAHGGGTDTWRKETNGRPLDVGASATPIASRGRPAMRTITNQLRVRSLAALVAIAIVLAACSAPAGGGSAPAPVTGGSPAPAAPSTGGGYSY